MRSGRVNATTLVHFEPVTGESFEPAGRLEMYRSLRGEERRAWQSGTLPVVTALLVGVQVRLWWLGGGLWEFSGFPIIEALLTKWGMRETASIFENGESWRLLTMGFLHTEPLHIAGNTIFLAFTAYNLERTIGRANLLVLYVGAVIAGSVLSSMLGPETPSLGASGGVYGLIAAMVTVAFARPKLLGPRMRVFFLLTSLPYMVLMFLTGLSSERVDNSAHFGGLVTGLVLGLVLAPDVAERRPGDNARARASVLELCMLALVIPVLVGPRIAPLQDAVSRRNNVAYVEALGQRLGLFEADEPAVSRTLHYRVPAAWPSLFDATRATAFVSPLSRGELRAWRVSERSSDDLVDLIELAGEWREDVLDEWPGAIFDPPRASTLAGLDGLQVVGRIGHGAGERILEWRGVARGVSSLQAVWQVDVASAKRLEPLKRRLLNSVRWELPESWREAEIELATFPDSLSRKQEFAREQIRIGNWREGAALLWEVVQADPDAPTTWTSALADLRPALTRLEDPDRWFGAALEHAPVPQVVEEIAQGLDELGRTDEAIGLVELAWRQSPGERRIRRARRRLGLSRELDRRTGRPWEETHDPLTGTPREAPPLVGELSLARAAEAGERYRAARAALVEHVRELIERGDRDAIAPLLFLYTGRIDLDDRDAVGTMLDELDQVAGGRELRWLPSPLADAVAEDPRRVDRLRAP